MFWTKALTMCNTIVSWLYRLVQWCTISKTSFQLLPYHTSKGKSQENWVCRRLFCENSAWSIVTLHNLTSTPYLRYTRMDFEQK